MISFDMILKIIITAILGYVALNTFLHFHFSMDRVVVGFFAISLIAMIFYLDTNKWIEFVILIGIFIVIGVGLFLFFLKKKRMGFFLFNTYKKQFPETKKEILAKAEELEIQPSQICYDRCKPWLVVIKDAPFSAVHKLFKELDTADSKKPKHFTMYTYVALVIYLIIIAALWRF